MKLLKAKRSGPSFCVCFLDFIQFTQDKTFSSTETAFCNMILLKKKKVSTRNNMHKGYFSTACLAACFASYWLFIFIFIFYILLLKHLSTHLMFKHNKLLQRSITKYMILLALKIIPACPAGLNSTSTNHPSLPAVPTPAPSESFAGPELLLQQPQGPTKQFEVKVSTSLLSPQGQDMSLSLSPSQRF